MPKVPLRDRILALLESEDEHEPEEETAEEEEVEAQSELTPEAVQEMISAAVAEALSISGSSTPDASDPEQTPAPQRAPRPTARTQKMAAQPEIPDFKTMTHLETRDWYETKFKPDLMVGRETIDWSDR